MGYLGRQMAVSDCGILDHGELLITYKLQIMKHLLILLFTACTLLMHAQAPEGYPANYAKAPRFKALIYYTQHAEEAHVQFAEQATTFFKKLNYGDGFVLDITDKAAFPVDRMKDIAGVKKGSVVIESELLKVAAFIRDRYGSTMNEALKTVLPIKRKIKSVENTEYDDEV